MTHQLPKVEKIQGLSLESSRQDERCRILLQYTDSREEWHEMEMRFSDLVYLQGLAFQAMETAKNKQLAHQPEVSNRLQRVYPEVGKWL